MKKALKIIGWTVLVLVGAIVAFWAWVEDVKAVQYAFGGAALLFIVVKTHQEHEDRKYRTQQAFLEQLRLMERLLERIAFHLENRRL